MIQQLRYIERKSTEPLALVKPIIGKIVNFYNQQRAEMIANCITPFLSHDDTVLDFGCGTLRIAEAIQRNIDVNITGIDVIDINATTLPFRIYDGQTIPFEDKSFDVTYAAFVFHHTTNIERLMSECVRVTKRRLLILEDVYQNKLELLVTKAMDSGNIFYSSEMDIPFNFMKKSQWIDLFHRFNVHNIKIQKIFPVPLRPVRHRLFVLDLN